MDVVVVGDTLEEGEDANDAVAVTVNTELLVAVAVAVDVRVEEELLLMSAEEETVFESV